MRRRQSRAFVKVLSVAAAFAAITSGTVMAYAADGYTAIQIGENGRKISIEELADSSYRQSMINAFNSGDPIYIEDSDGKYYEISENATVDEGIFTPIEYIPYVEI